MKLYINKFYELPLVWQALILTAAMVITWGVIGPSLVSSNSTIAVYLGIVIVVSATYACYKLSSKIIKELSK